MNHRYLTIAGALVATVVVALLPTLSAPGQCALILRRDVVCVVWGITLISQVANIDLITDRRTLKELGVITTRLSICL
jgi:hypothetical protein